MTGRNTGFVVPAGLLYESRWYGMSAYEIIMIVLTVIGLLLSVYNVSKK